MNYNILWEETSYYPKYCDLAAQNALLDVLAECLCAAPFFTPVMPHSNQPWSIRMSNLGALGWMSDKNGYRYQPRHPETDHPWPALPQSLIKLWHDVSGWPAPPQCCLINYYDKPHSKMGLHQDRDEQALDAPVVSVSLGDSAVFRMGQVQRGAPTRSLRLHSGDVFVFGGSARLRFHGLDRVFYGSSQLLDRHTRFQQAKSQRTKFEQTRFRQGGRLNLTLRRVTRD